MKKFIIGYIIMAILSWFLISGWLWAQDYSLGLKAKFDRQFDIELALSGALIWPLTLPIFYYGTSFAKYGWMPVWRTRK